MEDPIVISSTIQEWGGLRFWKNRQGYYVRSGSNLHHKALRLHVLVWEMAHGRLPSGYVVHHVDHNPDNNCLSNLVAMHHAEHVRHHRKRQLLPPDPEREAFVDQVMRYLK